MSVFVVCSSKCLALKLSICVCCCHFKCQTSKVIQPYEETWLFTSGCSARESRGKASKRMKRYIWADSIKAADGRSPCESTMKTQVRESWRLTTTRRRCGESRLKCDAHSSAMYCVETCVLTKPLWYIVWIYVPWLNLCDILCGCMWLD